MLFTISLSPICRCVVLTSMDVIMCENYQRELHFTSVAHISYAVPVFFHRTVMEFQLSFYDTAV